MSGTKKIKKIGVLTSGGDCAGLNAVIRAIVHHARLTYDWEVIGIKDGTHGLMERPINHQTLDVDDVGTNVLRMGGTFLGTINYGDPFNYPMEDGTKKDRSQEVIDGYHELGLDAMICMGGDGSFAILQKLAAKGDMNIIAIPKTIDNDVGVTETAIGYQTAVEVATEALDRLQPTAASHHRVMILEVMGRDAGHIALSTGIAGGADVILIPEIKYNLDTIVKHIQHIRERRKRNYCLVVVAEAVKTEDGSPILRVYDDGRARYGGIGHYLGDEIRTRTGGVDTRVTVLGHVLRGSPPTAADRVLASAFGVHAVDMAAEGKFDRMLAWRDRDIIDVPIAEGIKSYRAVKEDSIQVQTARGLGVCFGDKS